LKCECRSKTAVRLQELSPKASRSISRVLVSDSPSFTQNLMQTIARFCHLPQTKQNKKSKKHSCKSSVCSQCGVTWQADAIGFRKCDLGLPSHLLSLRQL
jgi:hypothetical protein